MNCAIGAPASRHGALALRLKRAVPEAGAPVQGKLNLRLPASEVWSQTQSNPVKVNQTEFLKIARHIPVTSVQIKGRIVFRQRRWSQPREMAGTCGRAVCAPILHPTCNKFWYSLSRRVYE
jgi:hypothetical protein